MSEIPDAENTLMEVHHHTKHAEHKKWTEYVFEFLMLFIAVTAGFFAENIREHHVEKIREKELAVSLYDDIKKDTAALHTVVKFSHDKKVKLDSAISLLHSYPDNWNDTAFYLNITPLIRVNTFQRSGATFEQIKSSGFLRYFNQSMVNLFNEYDVTARKIREREDLENQVAIEIMIPYMSDIINMEAAYDIFNNEPVTHTLYLNQFDERTIMKIINLASLAKRGRDRTIFEYTNLLQVADTTLSALKQEYDLE